MAVESDAMPINPQPSAAIADRMRCWLAQIVEAGGSDLHLVAGHPPVQRLHGELLELAEPPLKADETAALIRSICTPEALTALDTQKDIDFSFVVPLDGAATRFRANLFHTERTLAACLRLVPEQIPDFSWAGFPIDLAERLAFIRDGLVIVTGATGSGKTTTLAMIVNLINRAGGYRIITVEQPVEYIFPKAKDSLVTQREVGGDVASFADGLKYGLRQDPDVILVGEIRDQETAQMALSAAETGHLVFTTLHTRDAKGAITRFADLFPQEGQREVRTLLALSLRAIISQRLLPGIQAGTKRHLALEILWNTNPIAASIRNNKIESIDTYLLTNRDEGMLSFDESVRLLMRAGKISREVAEQNVRELAVLNR
jgi:twitching motility protein PilT